MDKRNVLIVDDHLMIVEGYKLVLKEYYRDKIKLNIDHATSCQEAYDKISFKKKIEDQYDLICLDMNIPAAEGINFYSGEDVGIWIREEFPTIFLMIMTMHSDNYRLANILSNLNPDVFILKKDVDPPEFVTAFEKCLRGEVYYSNSVSNFMRSSFSSEIILDKNDRSILYYLYKGVQTKELTEYIPLSLPSIEKRKRVMKELFDIQGGDLALINAAKRNGFL